MTTPAISPQRPPVTKTYPDAPGCDAAARHLRFLTDACTAANTPAWIRLPAAERRSGKHLVMERLDGAPARVADLPTVATALGYLHAATYRAGLHAADLDQPFPIGGWTIPPFSHLRRTALAGLPTAARHGPAAIYKDSNIRNVLVDAPEHHPGTRSATEPGSSAQGITTDVAATVGIVDFDDLTLAPFGYDLAKLLISAAMTHGRIAATTFDDCLRDYNTAVGDAIRPTAHDEPPHCSRSMLAAFIQIHHVLTAKYLGRHGYRYLWPQVRSWPVP